MWAFNQPPNYGVNTNPTEGELFVNDHIDRNDALVREAGQNTLDAKKPASNRVELRFTVFRGTAALDATAFAPYVNDLRPHLAACGVELDTIDFNAPSALLVEDFGTVGLEGDTATDDSNNFSLFWRNVGESHKEGSRGGRWGLGKTVFANSSRISTWFGLTIRADDHRKLLMGQVALRKHKLDGVTYQPHALYSASQPGEFEMPITDPTALESFSHTFRLTRTNEPGLSVVVPFPHESITVENLLKAAILHYFFPILQGKLVIKVNNRELNANTLRMVAAELDKPELRDMGAAIAFAEEICALPQGAEQSLDNPAALNFPRGQICPDVFEPQRLINLKRSYQEGVLIGITVPVSIRPKHDDVRPSSIKLFLKHMPLLPRGHDFYLRGGVSVLEHRSFGESEKAIGILIADDEAVSQFLGDAENPSHTAWNAKGRGLESRYNEPQKTVMFIRRSLRQLFDLLAREEGVEDPNALLNIFFHQRQGDADQRGGQSPGTEPPLPPLIPLKSRPQKIELSRVHTGFVVRPGKDLLPSDLPFTITVEAAYDVRRGNPFNKYDRSDFEFETPPIEIKTDTSRVSAIAGTGKLLSFQANVSEFEVEVIGFDPHRDLKLRTHSSLEEVANDQTV